MSWADFSTVQWRKSSYTDGSGGQCVELGQWRKSSYTGSSGGQCVEVAVASPAVAVRDSKDPDGPKLLFGSTAWRVFSSRVKSGKLDLR